MNYRILIVDDEPDILEFVSYNLKKEGYEVYTARDGKEGVDKALEVVPHLILMDIMMPVMDGVKACEVIRTYPKLEETVVVFLSARGEEETQIASYNAGGDDYIKKPIIVKVLASHIRAVLKRVYKEAEEDEKNADRAIRIDNGKHLVIKDGIELNLPRKEYNLLSLLYSKPFKVFTRDEIYRSVWGTDVIVGDRTIDVHIRKLREKIGENHIITIKGVGYKYVD